MNQIIYHITSRDEWDYAQINHEYCSKTFAQEGFIHCSYIHQLVTVANRFFRGQNNLVLLAIDRNEITSEIVDENLEGGTELYPHLYGLLPITAVTEVMNFPCNTDGGFSLPKQL
ncbi:MAG: DUF952 domain-containing protein [Pleurocapsa sp.]